MASRGNFINFEGTLKAIIKTTSSKLSSTKIELEQKSMEDIQKLEAKMNMKSTVFKNEIQTNITALEKNSKEAIENVVAELLSTKIELEQQSAEDLQMLKETLITKDTDIKNEFQTDINDLELRSKESYIENLEAELNITTTHLEQKTVEAIQNLEKSMKIKDNDLKFEIQNSINDLEQLSLKEAIENVGEEIENIKTQLENQKPSLNMQEPIPTICK